jgi:hypothetical protein
MATRKIPHTTIRNVAFKSAAQIALIKKAAKYHEVSFSAFVARVLEQAALIALELPPDDRFRYIASKVLSEPPASSKRLPETESRI